MAFRAEVTLSNRSAFVRSLRAQAQPIAEARLDAIGARFVDIAKARAAKVYFQRPAARRNPANRLRYTNGFYARRSSFGTFPVTLTVGNRARHAVILEKGQDPHSISSPNLTLPGGKDQWLGNNGVTAIDAFGDGKRKTQRELGEGVRTVRHPGAKGIPITEESLVEAARAEGVSLRGATFA